MVFSFSKPRLAMKTSIRSYFSRSARPARRAYQSQNHDANTTVPLTHKNLKKFSEQQTYSLISIWLNNISEKRDSSETEEAAPSSHHALSPDSESMPTKEGKTVDVLTGERRKEASGFIATSTPSSATIDSSDMGMHLVLSKLK